VRVHDAYVTGEGILHASLLGLFSLVDMRGGGKSNRGRIDALLRRGSLVSHGAATYPEEVRWEAVDDRIAYAMLTEGSISTTMLFTFDKQGLMRPWAQRRADAQWTARSFRRPGKVAFGTTTSVAVCEYRSLVRWPGCSARGREALLAWSHYWRSTTSSRGDRGSVPTGLDSPRACFGDYFPERPSEQRRIVREAGSVYPFIQIRTEQPSPLPNKL
jgi:hypothetical protein